MAWQRVASAQDVKADQGFQVKIGDKLLAIFRLGENVYALEGVCPHAEAYLAEGFIDGDKVECPLHQAQFHIPTGKCLGAPADRDLAMFPVKVEGNDILIDV
jgi:3-phenylpropionate/trans-cinnamate dioxygenase ferredoxin component